MLIDTHCHLDFPEFDPDRAQVIQRANEQGIELMINVGSSLRGSLASVELAEKFACVYAAVGVHPHEAKDFRAENIPQLEAMARRNKVVAVGEIGLDYFKNYSPPENQRELFKALLTSAQKLGLPVVLHCRQAEADTLGILKEFPSARAVVHCFSGDEAFLRSCLALGFYVSFTCNITYKKAEGLRQLLKIVPLDRLILETDAPYLAPEGLRGRRNEPANVKLLCESIARIKELSPEELAATTTANAKKFFNL